MAVTSIFGLGLIELLVLFGGVGSVPVGAPLPLDPVLSAIAPENCLWYTATTGIGPADPGSTNETEKLFAEPQVQRFLTEAETLILSAVRRAGGPNEEQRTVAEQVPKLVRAVFTRPMAIFVEDVQPGPEGAIVAEAALVLRAGDNQAEVAEALNQLLALARTHGNLNFTEETVGGIAWQRAELPPQAPRVRYGWKDSYLIIAVGDATAAKIAERMSGAAPAWLARIRAEHPVEREFKVGYVNIAGILTRVKPLLEQQNPQAWPAMERLGVTNITALDGVVGYDGVACTSNFHLVTADGNRPGVLGFLPHEPLTADDLAFAPKDAMFAAAVRLNAREVVDHAVGLAAQFEPRAREDFERAMWEMENAVGVNLRDDILTPLGSTWTAYLPAGDLMTSWLNASVGVSVTDADRLRIAVNKLVESAKQDLGATGEAIIVGTTVGEHMIYSLQFTREPVPVSPSWCITDKWVVFGLMPQAVQAAVERKAEDSLANRPEIAAALQAEVAPASLVYQDTPRLFQALYPLVQMGVQMISGPLRQQGFELDSTILPSAEVILKHLRPNVSVMGHSADGFHFTNHGTLPGGNVVGMLPVAGALLIPAVGSARGAAQQAQEMNHMKMVALALLNYESAHGHLPTDIYDEDGNPLLSWRVQLLPFMEENAIYQQIRRDEPWDSEHNRQFHNIVPMPFQSVTRPLPAGMTRVVGLKGEDTMFRGKEPVRLAQVRDGTSNTLFFVEAAPEAAVEWMKPADIEFDEENPFAGLAQPEGFVLAAFVDGHVSRLSLGIAPEMLKAVISRAGGEVVEYDALNAPPQPLMVPAVPAEQVPDAVPADVAIPAEPAIVD